MYPGTKFEIGLRAEALISSNSQLDRVRERLLHAGSRLEVERGGASAHLEGVFRAVSRRGALHQNQSSP
jgi:hypothetical protein